MDDQLYQELRKIGEDIIFVKTTLENMGRSNVAMIQSVEEKFEEKIKVANHRIEDLEEANKWLWRSVIGAFVAYIVTFFLK